MRSGQLLAMGLFDESRVRVSFDPALTRETSPEIEARIEQTWRERTAAWPGTFDGGLVRVDSIQFGDGAIDLRTGPSSYRQYVGTHHGPPLDDRFRANPLCVSCAVRTSDGMLVLMQRAAGVEDEGRWHVVGGHVESPRHVDGAYVRPFRAVADELREELGVETPALALLRCVGLTRPEPLLKPELLFLADVRLRFAELRLDREHQRAIAVPARRDFVERFASDNDVVACGLACLTACGPLLE